MFIHSHTHTCHSIAIDSHCNRQVACSCFLQPLFCVCVCAILAHSFSIIVSIDLVKRKMDNRSVPVAKYTTITIIPTSPLSKKQFYAILGTNYGFFHNFEQRLNLPTNHREYKRYQRVPGIFALLCCNTSKRTRPTDRISRNSSEFFFSQICTLWWSWNWATEFGIELK